MAGSKSGSGRGGGPKPRSVGSAAATHHPNGAILNDSDEFRRKKYFASWADDKKIKLKENAWLNLYDKVSV